MTMQPLLRISLVLLTLCALRLPALAQATDDEYDFSEIPVEEEEIPYIGVGGGYQLQMVLFDRDELNALADRLSVPQFEGSLFMHGGGGWTAIGIIPNLRVGVYGGGGSKEVEIDDSVGAGRYHRSLQFSNGFTAALIDYAISPVSKLTIAPGLMIGGGGTTVEYTQTRTGMTFDSFFDRSGDSSDSRQASMTRSYVHFVPMVNLEYALTQFILLRVGGGYAMSFDIAGSRWTDRHSSDINGVPDKLTADGPMLQAGVFLGLFQQ